jgi:hypothetical protein
MINSLVKVGIICPCDIEYQSCKEILNLHNETELAGRLISSRKEKDKVGSIRFDLPHSR